MSDLKPCPFCSNTDALFRDTTGFPADSVKRVICDCGASGGWCTDYIKADNKWNRRPVEDALRAEVEELKATTTPTIEAVAMWDWDRATVRAEKAEAEVARLREALGDAIEAHEHGDIIVHSLKCSWNARATTCECGAANRAADREARYAKAKEVLK